ncbi:MAG: 23S rRNA (uracil(1939)-C(5))-methyltransferase RlmD [Steroidobacteraceae bacterium]|nr:23S rRNA (uracil(1939)-C(5))-methyltransferase RlmD [Steroidobacteraceae bacterium]
MSRQQRESALAEEGVVTDLTHEAEGVVKAGKTCFVAGALPGERVRFRRVRKCRQHDDGELEAVLEPSPQRVVPRCAHFGVCGGCALQHLEPGAQLAIKQRELRESLFRLGGVSPVEWLEPLAGPIWGYRRRARLSARYVRKKRRALVGFRERSAPYVADVQRCEVLAPPVGELLAPLADLLTSLDGRECIPQLEVAVSERDVALIVRHLEPLAGADLQKLRDFEQQYGVRFYLQARGPDTVRPLGDAPIVLQYGLPDFDLTLDFLPADFVQVNAAINRKLTSRAVELLGLLPDSRVLDLYCGLGNFTLPIARRTREVVGVEGDAGLIERACANAVRNGVGNARFHVADLAVAPDLRAPWLQGEYSHVLLDPPRVGAEAMLDVIARLAPRRIVYVSCHTGSLARDVGLLCGARGYRLLAAGVVDMFPHTTHAESIALLERQK